MTAQTADWKRLLRGAFAFETAPFAVHPYDEQRAIAAISAAIKSGVSRTEIESEIEHYLLSRNCSVGRISDQLSLFREYFKRLYAEMRNCWILSKPLIDQDVFVAIFSGRTALDEILYRAMCIYQSRELNQATQFMRAKKKIWPTFKIHFYKFPGGGLWEGRATIGYDPSYLLVRADATLSNRLAPDSVIVWKAKAVPADPGPTWQGLRYSA